MRYLYLSLIALLSVAGYAQFDNPAFVGGLNRASSSTLNNGLVAYYRLEESSGTRTDDVNSYNLSVSGTVNQETGKINYGAGNTGVSGKLTNNYGAELNPPSMTISFWYCSASVGNPIYFMVNGSHIDDARRNYYIKYIGTNAWYFKAGQEKTWTSVLTTNIVYNMVFLYDAATTNVNLYTNGVYCTPASTNAFTIAKTTNSAAFNLLGSYNTFDQLGGWIDEVGFWNRVLTTNEISELYNSGSGKQRPF